MQLYLKDLKRPIRRTFLKEGLARQIAESELPIGEVFEEALRSGPDMTTAEANSFMGLSPKQFLFIVCYKEEDTEEEGWEAVIAINNEEAKDTFLKSYKEEHDGYEYIGRNPSAFQIDCAWNINDKVHKIIVKNKPEE